MPNMVFAADLGGTNLRVAAVTEDGTVLHTERTPTPTSRKRDDIVAAIESAARKCLDNVKADSKPMAFGVAVPAIISLSDGTIFNAPNLPDLNGLNLEAVLSSRMGLPVRLENDANAAAVGEHWLGASRGFETSICITLGTGVGGGLIIGGKLFRGIDGTAGEIGHITVEPEGHPCGCGSLGCLEQYASATAIMRLAKGAARDFPDSPIARSPDFSAKDVFEAGKDGDALSLAIFKTFGTYLGIALAGLINVLNPEVIVVGGGAAAGWDLYIKYVNEQIIQRAFRVPGERAKIVRAALGEDAGIMGSAKLAFESA